MANKKKTTKAQAQAVGQQMPTDVIRVKGYENFHEQAERLRQAGYVELPGVLGGGSGNGAKTHYDEFISSQLTCQDGSGPTKDLPLLHVSSCGSVSVTAANGHKGEFITWGWGNRLPNVVGLLSSLLPYTAVGHRFNKNLMSGLGIKPVYRYVQYVGGNITEKRINFSSAGELLQGLIRDRQRELLKLEEEHPELKDSAQGDSPSVLPLPLPQQQGQSPSAQSTAEQMHRDLKEQIADLRRDYDTWEQTNKELQTFLRDNNLSHTFLQMADNMDLYDLCYAELLLNQKQIDPETKRQVSSKRWTPKVTGIRYRDCHTIRLEKKDSQNRINHVFISNQWLDHPEIVGDSLTVDAIRAIDIQSPTQDLERTVAAARKDNVKVDDRPTRFVLPISYGLSGRPYYPIPAWFSIFSGDVYTYVSMLISDRSQRRKNANVIGRIIFLSDEYLQRLYSQRNAITDEDKKKLFNTIITEINTFLKNRDNMGEPLVAYNFTGADGKVYKSWEIVEVESNSKGTAEANKEELAEVSSIVLFAKSLDSQLIGNTPGTTNRSGGTDLRERYLLKEIQMSPVCQLMLTPFRVAAEFNHWDTHLDWDIRRMTMTTLDNSKNGLVESAETE